MLGKLFSFLTNALLAALVLGAAVPGTHRVIFPEAYGLSEVSPRLWTDAPSRARELRGLAIAARAHVAKFFGDSPPKPTLILCSTRKCARNFGIGGNGLSIADVAVMVSPGGLTKGTLTHEMTHSRLHRSMGIRNLIRQPYPTWFDEGLATLVANHPRWRGTVAPAARKRVRDVQHFWQWKGAMRDLGVGKAYTAASAEVAAIEARAGHIGLLELVARAEAGEDFNTVLKEITAR